MSGLRNYLKNYSSILIAHDYLYRTIPKIRYKINPQRALSNLFKSRFGYYPDLEAPKTYSEKIQWIKLHYHNPLLAKYVDKYEVREFVKSKGMGDLLNRIIGVWDRVNEIPFDSLPEKFVLKATHGSGWNVICKNKKQFDVLKAKTKLNRWMRDNFFWHYYEWVYKNIKPRVICEEYIEPEDGVDLKDYKIFCFDGVPRFLFVASGRSNGKTHFDFYTTEWEWLPVQQYYPNAGNVLPRPELLDDMLEVARRLSNGFSHVRVDLYVENHRIYFGELTFGHFSGLHPFTPSKYDMIFGEYFTLPKEYI